MAKIVINGGYYIKARQIQDSEISKAPPYVREIWDWLLKEANHTYTRYGGFEVKRGQLFRSYNDIREGLSWFVGWRKMMYNENHTKKAMKFLREARMIATRKEPGGVLITICNYDIYQNPANYERTNESTTDRTIEEPLKNQTLPYNNKKNNKKKNERMKRTTTYSQDFELWWSVYPRKVGKKVAYTSFKRSGVDVDILVSAVERHIASDEWQRGYVPNPATWLNQGRWEDEILTAEEKIKMESEQRRGSYAKMFKS